MVIFKNSEQISSFLSGAAHNKKIIGFVPTMGALHEGHLSLIRSSKEQNDLTVCSIFINPSQFNNQEDLERYPVTIEKDIELLISSGCDVLFYPTVEQIYPPGYQKKNYPLGTIETIFEGQYRPGHFQGVCEVVDRLLDIIQPQTLYVGQKDYQQCMVIQKLLELKGKEKETMLMVEPTMREPDGLAMSSRNLRLSETDRQKAATLNKVLTFVKDNLGQLPLKVLKRKAKNELEEEGFVVDYMEIADARTLEPVHSYSDKLVALAAATINNVRLIDNVVLN
jgi:pantoate--beta-alanine ligase